jgi:hypothetical protein
MELRRLGPLGKMDKKDKMVVRPASPFPPFQEQGRIIMALLAAAVQFRAEKDGSDGD